LGTQLNIVQCWVVSYIGSRGKWGSAEVIGELKFLSVYLHYQSRPEVILRVTVIAKSHSRLSTTRRRNKPVRDVTSAKV